MLREELELTNRIVFLGSRSQEVLPLVLFGGGYGYRSLPLRVVRDGRTRSDGVQDARDRSKVGGLSLSVQDGITGYLVPNGDPDKLADKIELCSANPG